MDPAQERGDQTFVELRRKIMEAHTAEFHARPELAGGGMKQIAFQIVYAAALIDAAAEIGIDAGMSADQFVGVIDESFKRNLGNAPRFG